MIDVESRLARLKMDEGRERNHGLARRADRGAGRGAAVADVRQRVGLRIARRVVGAGECTEAGWARTTVPPGRSCQ